MVAIGLGGSIADQIEAQLAVCPLDRVVGLAPELGEDESPV